MDSAKRSRTGYLLGIAEYEKIYETKSRAIKRWREIGLARNPPEPPPLDNPSEMVTWWERCMTNRPSAGVLAARERFLSGEISQPASAVGEIQPPTPVAAKTEKARPGRIALTADQLAAIVPMEMDGHLSELKRTAATLRAEYEEAARNRALYDDTTYQRALKRYQDAVQSLVQLEDQLAEQRLKNGTLVPLDTLRAELPPLLSTIADGFVSFLINNLSLPRARALTEVDRLFRAFRESRFA